MSYARVEEQLSLLPLPPAGPVFRRLECACGCGLWFYWRRAKHRPPAYASPECYWRARHLRRAKREG